MKKSIIIDKIKEKKNEFITAKQRKLNELSGKELSDEEKKDLDKKFKELQGKKKVKESSIEAKVIVEKLDESSNFYILDNGGETVDRYTLVTTSGEIYGFSDNPYGAQGFGQYCGNLYDWREHSPEDYVKSMVGSGKDKIIQLSNLSPNAQKFVMERKDESFINKRKPMKESGNRIKEYDKVYWNYTDPNSGKVIPMNGIVQNIQGQKAYVESKSNYANRGFGVYLNQLSKTPLNEDTYDNPQKESVKKSIKQEVVLKEDVMINGIIFESGEKLGILD